MAQGGERDRCDDLDVIRMTTPVGLGAIYPYYGGCPGGTGGTCGYVAKGLSQSAACSGALVCGYTDTGSSSTSAYTIKIGSYSGNLVFWPGWNLWSTRALRLTQKRSTRSV